QVVPERNVRHGIEIPLVFQISDLSRIVHIIVGYSDAGIPLYQNVLYISSARYHERLEEVRVGRVSERISPCNAIVANDRIRRQRSKCVEAVHSVDRPVLENVTA